MGNTERGLTQRLRRHRGGHGARLTSVVQERGIAWAVSRVWEPGGFALERQLKRQHHGPRLCPICRGELGFNQAYEITIELLRKGGDMPYRGYGWELWHRMEDAEPAVTVARRMIVTGVLTCPVCGGHEELDCEFPEPPSHLVESCPLCAEVLSLTRHELGRDVAGMPPF